MTYRGTVTGGVVVLEHGVVLPEGTPVQVEALGAPAEPQANAGADFVRLLNELEAEVGLLDGPTDFSIQHDHYLYGAPKRPVEDAE
jgi:hypothetical protein